MGCDLVIFPSHDWRRRLTESGLRHVALVDEMIADPDIERLLWVRRVHPRRLLLKQESSPDFVRKALIQVGLGCLYQITRYAGSDCTGRYLFEHHLPHSADGLIAVAVKLWWRRTEARRVLWVGDPKESWSFDRLPAERSVFDVMDDWANAPEFASQRTRILEGYRLARKADVICANTPQAGMRFDGHSRLLMLPNAIGNTLKEAVGRRLSDRPQLGLIGHYSAARLDRDLVKRTLKARPDCDLRHAGRWLGDRDQFEQVMRFSNFKAMGVLSPEETQSLLAGLDALLVPHPVSSYTLSQDRLTVYDALALGVPVVSTAIPPAVRLENYCYVATDESNWLMMLDMALNEPESFRDARIHAMATETWHERWKALKEAMCD
jgi:hypothetical protein